MGKVMKKDEMKSKEVVERPYTLRKLKDGDLFPMLRLLRKVGLNNFKTVLSKSVEGKDVKETGISVFVEMADIIIANIGTAEEEIYSVWSELSGIPADEIKEMEFGTLPMMIYDTFREVKNTSFFKVLSKLL